MIESVKLIAKLKLKASREQAEVLKATMVRANECCDWLSDQAWKSKRFQKFAIQKANYARARTKFGLTAQVVIRCIAKVADAYKLDKKTQRVFRPTGAISYDDRILSWNIEHGIVSIWTVSGRLKIPFVGGDKQLALLNARQGETDLILHRGVFYLAAICNAVEVEAQVVADFLGLDLGVTNISSDSDGQQYSGKEIGEAKIERALWFGAPLRHRLESSN